MSEFHSRLLQACNDNPDIPEYGRGQQTFLSQRLDVSQEAVRKWFAGESKPKAAVGRKLADLLGVDYVWLALGTSYGEIEKRKTAASRQDSALYALTGYLIEKGFACAFDDNESNHIDLMCIQQGVQNFIAVKACKKDKDFLCVSFSQSAINVVTTIAAVRTDSGSFSYDFLWIKPDVWADYGQRNGNEIAIKISANKGHYEIGSTTLKKYFDAF